MPNYEAQTATMLADPDLGEAQRATLTDYHAWLLGREAKPGSIYNHLSVARAFGRHLRGKDFREAETQDWQGFVATWRATYKVATRHTKGTALRFFARWLHRSEPGEYPDVVAHLRFKRPELLPRNLPTAADVLLTARAADNARDRVLVLVLADGGIRAGEAAELQLQHVRLDDHGAVLMVHGKGDKDRRVRLVTSAPELRAYLARHHPAPRDPRAPVFPDRHGRHLSSNAIFKVVQKWSAKALGPERAFGPHRLRHLRATALAGKLREPLLRQHFGWSPSSRMVERYVRLRGDEADHALLESEGLVPPTNGGKEARRPCPRCEQANPAANDFCARCAQALTPEALALEAPASPAAAPASELLALALQAWAQTPEGRVAIAQLTHERGGQPAPA